MAAAARPVRPGRRGVRGPDLARRGADARRANSWRPRRASPPPIQPEAAYDRGNALVMLGQYPDAVAQYDRALDDAAGLGRRARQPRAGAARADADRQSARRGGGRGEAAPDETYRRDRDREQSGRTCAPGGDAMSDEAIRALWLRRVQTRPADFLRARFAYQLQQPPAAENSDEPGGAVLLGCLLCGRIRRRRRTSSSARRSIRAGRWCSASRCSFLWTCCSPA